MQQNNTYFRVSEVILAWPVLCTLFVLSSRFYLRTEMQNKRGKMRAQLVHQTHILLGLYDKRKQGNELRSIIKLFLQ